MKMNDFVCSCLNIDGGVIDRITDDFDIDIEESDVFECIKHCGDLRNVGREMLYMVYEKIIDEYSDVLFADKFDYDFSSPSYPCMYYDGKEFSTKEELDDIVEELDPTAND